MAYQPTKFMAPGSYYDQLSADIACGFINCLTHPGGQWAGEPFVLLDWQEQLIRNVFGVRKATGYRQFRTTYTEIPKKQGKSELAAAVALLLTCADHEPRAEVYSCASDRGQASIVFDVAADMVDQCRELRRLIRPVLSQKKLIYKPLNSFYQVLSAEAYSKHGFNVHGVIFDELHALPDRKFFDVMTTGSGFSRTQPLYFIITTAGVDKTSVCWLQHQKAQAILDGRRSDPSFYPTIYAMPEEADWQDEANWRACNPSMGVTCQIDDYRTDYRNALTDPVLENQFKQLYLNVWVNNAVRWMPSADWRKCAFPVVPQRLEKRVCYGGLDLSSTTDLTAFVLVFPPKDPEDEADKYQILPFFWIPEEQMQKRIKRDHVRYDEWVRDGFLMTTPGNAVDYTFIEHFIVELHKKYNIKEFAFDPWNSGMLVQKLENEGMKAFEFGQGYKSMSPATKNLERLILTQRIAHGGNPVLEWMMGNVYVEHDAAANIKPNKDKSSEKIDGVVALVMALDRALVHQTRKKSVYETRGIPSYGKGGFR
ncbi:MAG: terminase large subunit [Oscillospiraceae bacterium]|jgi:phage terminase large subunit-like protein|nr:terminase large subunit [Oscillospiraceae bacterium]